MNIISIITLAVISTVMLLIFRALLADLFKDLVRHGKKDEAQEARGRKKKSNFKVLR